MTTEANLADRVDSPATEADFARFYQTELPRLYNFFRYRIGSDLLAEDLTAATFEKAGATVTAIVAIYLPFRPGSIPSPGAWPSIMAGAGLQGLPWTGRAGATLNMLWWEDGFVFAVQTDVLPLEAVLAVAEALAP